MNWRSKGNTNKSQEDLTGFVMLAIAVLFAVSVAVVMYRLDLERVDRDNVTLCRVDSYLTQETVLLLDATNSFTESHQETVLNHLREMLSRL